MGDFGSELGVWRWVIIAAVAVIVLLLMCNKTVNKILCILYGLAASFVLSAYSLKYADYAYIGEDFNVTGEAWTENFGYIFVLAAAVCGVWVVLFSLPIILKVKESLSLISNILVTVIVTILWFAICAAIGGGIAYLGVMFNLPFLFHIIGPIITIISIGGFIARKKAD